MSISNASATTASIQRWKKTTAGGETSLSGVDDSGTTLAYTPGYEQLYLNGVLLVRGADYIGTTGTTFTGLTALLAGDVVEVLSISVFSIADAYTTSQIDSLLSDIDIRDVMDVY